MSADDAAFERMVNAYHHRYQNSISSAGRPNYPHEMGVLAACSAIEGVSVENLSAVAKRFGEATWSVHQYMSATQDSQAEMVAKTVISASTRGAATAPASPYPSTNSVPTTPMSPSFNWDIGSGPRHVNTRAQKDEWVQQSPKFPQRTSTLFTSPPVSQTHNSEDGMPEGYCWVAPYDRSQGIRPISEIPASPTSKRSSRRLSKFGR